jgi:threonine synthase
MRATAAAGIRVPRAIGDFLILAAVRESGGFAIAVSEQAIAAARDDAAREDGLLLCPEGAATLAGWRDAVAQGLVGPEERAVLFNCASGLKYPSIASSLSAKRMGRGTMRSMVEGPTAPIAPPPSFGWSPSP